MIGKSAFEDLALLKACYIIENIQVIGQRAFMNCTGLTKSFFQHH